MDKPFLFRRMLALLVSLVMSFVPFFYGIIINHANWLTIFSYKEVLFSLSAIMVLSFCDIIEVIKKLSVNLIFVCFVIWFLALISGIFIYVTPDNSTTVSTATIVETEIEDSHNITIDTETTIETDVKEKTPQIGNIIFTIATIVIYTLFNIIIASNRAPIGDQKC